MAMTWSSFDRGTASAVALLGSVGRADGQSKVVGRGVCLDNTELSGVFPVQRLAWEIYA